MAAPTDPSEFRFLAGDGEMARRIRSHDWSGSPLGMPGTWPQSLKSALLICLNTPIVAAVHWGPDLRTLYNDVYAPALAERHPWALGQPFRDVWAEIWDVLGPQIGSVLETGNGFSTKRQRLEMNRNGRVEDTWWIYSFAPLHDDFGKPAGIFVTALDESDKVAAERKLASERDRQRKLFEQAPGFITILSGPELRFEFTNEAYCRLFGKRDYVGRTAREVFPDLEGQPFFDLLEKTFATGERFVAHANPIRLQLIPDAPLVDRFLDFIYEPVRDETGNITGLFVEGYDVTEAHVAQQALRESEGRFRALVNASSDVVYQMNADWTEMRQLDGRGFLADTRQPSIKWQDEYLFPEDRDHILAVVNRAIATRGNFELEHRVRRADGTAGWAFSRAVPVLDDEGKIVHWFGMASDVTERRFTETKLAESEIRYRQIVEGAEDFAIISLDPHGVITAWNRGAERLIGYTADEAVGQPGAIFFTAEDQAAGAADHEMNRSVAEGKVVDERWHVRKNGSRFWGSGLMMWLDRGEGYLKIFRDRTLEYEAEARRAALTALSDSLRDLDDPAEIGFVSAKILGAFLRVTRVGYAAIDHHAETLHVVRDWTAPDANSLAGTLSLRDYGSFVESLKRGEFTVIGDARNDPRTAGAGAEALERQSALSFVNAPILEQGRLVAVFFVNDNKARMWSENELVLIQDFADRTRVAVERANAVLGLRHLNDTLEAQIVERTIERNRLWDNAQDLLMLARYDATIVSINPAWMDVLGWSEEELVGTSFRDLVHPADAPDAEPEVERLSAEGRTTMKFENRYRNKAGAWIWLSWAVTSHDGLFHAVARDITVEKANTAKLLAAEDALRQSQKMEAVGQLTGGIAHDFNNMLAVVMGSLDLLDRRIGVGDPTSKRFVQAASESARRAANLTQRLLAFSRQQPLNPETLDINRLVSGMSDLLRHSLGADVRLATAFAEGLWQTNVDPNQLENVILNLAVNSRDAMPDGGRLTIETQNDVLDNRYVQTELGVPAGQYVLIAISDTGSGMPSDVIAKAFDPFFTTKEVGKGTGLGLSQVYGFVKQSGGHVKIYSEVGQGTTIKIYLPRSEQAQILGEAAEAVLDALRVDTRELILVVDDEPYVRQFSVDAFEELGYTVFQAESAAVALGILKDHADIALMFTDIVMPETNGRILADQAQIVRPGLKVLYTTGYARNAVVDNGNVGKGIELISKPFTIDDLARTVRAILDG